MARRPLVLIVGDDAHSRVLAAALDGQGADARVVDLDTHDAPSLDERGGVAVSGHDVSGARAVVLRRLPRAANPDDQGARERAALSHATLRVLDDGARLFVHPVAALELHQQKPLALARLARAGVRVPQSLATSDVRAARDFAARHREIVVKPIAGGALTRLLEPADLQRLSLAGTPPLFLQRRVHGPEHRVYLLGGRVLLAFAVPTEGVIDARARVHEARRVRCPPEVRAAALAAARALRLPFCAVDLRTDDDGVAVVLDVNATPSLLDYPDEGMLCARLAEWLWERCTRRAARA